MRRFSELLRSFAIWAVLSWCDGCITSAGDDLHSVNITNISAHFDFRYKNASNLSDSSLWAIISWNIEGEEKLDGILYYFTNSETDASWSRKKRNIILPPYPIPGQISGLLPGPGPGPGTSICDGVNDSIWAVNGNGTSVQCQVPCKGILADPCAVHGVCHYLKEDYKTIPRKERTVELPALFGKPYDLNLRAYKDWKTVEIAKIKMDSFFCRNKLIMSYGINEDVAEDFCARVQIIDKHTHTSGPVTDLKIAHTYRDMAVNRGVVIVEWQESFDVFPSVNLVQYVVYASTGDPDKGTVDVSDKDPNDFYRVKVENIKFEDDLVVQITPLTNISDCADCTEHGKPTTIKYRFSDIDACLGDNFTAQYCDNIASCVDLSLENGSAALCTCPAAYTGNAISTIFNHGTGCVALDSCALEGTGYDTCDPNAICFDLPPPSYGVNCNCPGNYIGDGYRSGSGCREKSLIIGLAVGIPLVVMAVLLAVYIVLKFWLQQKRVPHTPYVWNHLKPYAGTFDPEFVQDLPYDVFVGGGSGMTVQNLVDPEVDVRIDQANVVLPEINLTRGQLLTRMRRERASLPAQSDGIYNPKTKPLPWSEKKGSTRLTPFNKVQHVRPEIARRKGIIDFTDVSQLRRQMSTMYYGKMKKKDDDDFVRTSQDFYRMDLNVARDLAHLMIRFLFDQACRAYLGPSRESLRAYAKATRRPAIAEGEE